MQKLRKRHLSYKIAIITVSSKDWTAQLENQKPTMKSLLIFFV